MSSDRALENAPGAATVIGCVWGAHRHLVETFGDEAPTYAWCEETWKRRLQKQAPAPAAVPGWLYMELLFGWRAEQGAERASSPERQLSLFEVA